MSSRTGSYDPAREVRGLESELARLEAQVAVSWDREARLLGWLGLRDGMKVLEAGCGPGFVTERLLEMVPRGSLTALDSDPEMLRLARERVERAASRLDLVEASILATDLADGQFDFAVARYLFQHLAEPVTAAREILRLLRPGGRLAVIDLDAALWGIAQPAFPEVAPIYAKTGRAQASRGGDRLVGRRLYRILRDAGYQDVELDAFVYHSDAEGLDPFLPQLDPDRLLPLLEQGVLTPGEMETVASAHRRFLASPDAYVLMVGLVASGRKA